MKYTINKIVRSKSKAEWATTLSCLIVLILSTPIAAAASEPVWGGLDAYGPPCWPEAQGGGEGDGEEGSGPDGEDGLVGPKPANLSEPVWMPHGEYIAQHTDIFLPGRGLNIELTRSYRARSPLHAITSGTPDLRERAPFGIGWSHNYDQWVEPTSGGSRIDIYTGNERRTRFLYNSGWSGPGSQYEAENFHGVVNYTINGTEPIAYTTDENTVYVFKPLSPYVPGLSGRLESITDRNGNAITLIYESGGLFQGNYRLAMVQDGLGNSISFTYYDDPIAPRPVVPLVDNIEYADLVWKVTDHTGRTVEYLYNADNGQFLPNQELFIRELKEVVLPPIEQAIGTFDIPAEHARFTSGRSLKYEYFDASDRFTGLLTKVRDENGVDILENHYTQPDSTNQDTYVRRIYKQDFANDSYTYMITDREGYEVDVDTFYDYSIWLQRRNGTVVQFNYTGSISGNGTFRLEDRIDYAGTVPTAARGKVVWKDTRSGVNQWYYADTPLSTKTPFSGPVAPKRAEDAGLTITKHFEFNGDWHQTGFTKPNGDVVAVAYSDGEDDARARGALTSITTKPDGTVLDNDGLPLSTHPDWITQSFEYGFSFWSGVPGSCSCSTGRFATAIIDGNGNRTEKDYDANGNVTEIRHGIPSGSATPASTETFTYTTGGNIATHTHPETTRLVAGSPVPYTRVDEFVYYSDTYGTLDSEIASRGKLRYQRIDKNGENLETEYEYDAIGNVSKVIEPDGDVKTYLYNQGRQLVREQHWNTGETVLYAQTDYFYDANGNLVIEKVANLDSAQGVVSTNPVITTVYQYNERDQLIKKSVERGDVQVESITENTAHQATPPTGSDWVTQEWEYDENGNLTLFKDGEGVSNASSYNVVEYQYDFRDLLYKKIEGVGSTNPLVTQYNYDENKRLIERITNPDSVNGVVQLEQFAYDGHDRLISITDPMSNVATFGYDKNHNQIEIEVLGPLDADTDESLATDPAVVLFRKELEYDSRDRLKVEDVSVFDYLAGTQSAVQLQTTTYTYNENSSIRKVESPSGTFGILNTVEYFYDTVGRAAYVEDGDGNRVEYTYDADSNVTRIDQYDQSTSGPTEQQFITSYSYDALDRRISRVDGALNQTQWRYDSRFNRVMEIDGKDNATAYDYDGLNRLIATRVRMTADGDGPETDPVLDSQNPEIATTIIYDDSSRVIAEIDDNGNRTDYEYDAVNRRTAILLPGTLPDRDVYTTEYNGNGVAVKVTDARGVILNQEFDLNNRLELRKVDALSATIPDGSLHEKFTYDGLGRIVTATNYSNSSGTLGLTRAIRVYDSRGFVLRETQNADGANSFPMAMDRVVNYEFDLANNPTRILYPHGRDIRRSYDSINRLVSIADHEPMTPMPITDFDYLGRRLERRVNGNDTETAYAYDGYELAPVNVNDKGFGRVVGITTTDSSSSAVLDDFEFEWDASQNRISYNDVGSGMKNRRERSFGYDSSDRLVSTDIDFPDPSTDYTSPTNSGITEYDLDGVHNRFSVTGFEEAGAPIGVYKDVMVDDPDHVKNNQYTYTAHANGGSWINTYDANGNLTFRAEHNVSDFTGDYELDFFDQSAFLTAHGNHDPEADLNDDGVWDFFDISIFVATFTTGVHLDHQYFTYDFRNQLVGIELKSGTSTLVTVRNTYDPFARRVLESVGESPDVVTKQLVYGYYSLWEVVEQIQLETVSIPEKLLTSHIYGLGIDDEVAYRIEDLVAPEDFWSHRDDLHSLTSVTDINGDVQERYQYGDYGQVTIFDEAGLVRAATEVEATHLYTGRSLIMGTGLFDYRFRVMDPETGRFRQRDPLGYIDSMSMYAYVVSSPARWSDSYGLATPPPSTVGGWSLFVFSPTIYIGLNTDYHATFGAYISYTMTDVNGNSHHYGGFTHDIGGHLDFIERRTDRWGWKVKYFEISTHHNGKVMYTKGSASPNAVPSSRLESVLAGSMAPGGNVVLNMCFSGSCGQRILKNDPCAGVSATPGLNSNIPGTPLYVPTFGSPATPVRGSPPGSVNPNKP